MRIYYFVPEDGDEINHPNAFSIPDQTPTLARIKEVHTRIFILSAKVSDYTLAPPFSALPAKTECGRIFCIPLQVQNQICCQIW